MIFAAPPGILFPANSCVRFAAFGGGCPDPWPRPSGSLGSWLHCGEPPKQAAPRGAVGIVGSADGLSF